MMCSTFCSVKKIASLCCPGSWQRLQRQHNEKDSLGVQRGLCNVSCKPESLQKAAGPHRNLWESKQYWWWKQRERRMTLPHWVTFVQLSFILWKTFCQQDVNNLKCRIIIYSLIHAVDRWNDYVTVLSISIVSLNISLPHPALSSSDWTLKLFNFPPNLPPPLSPWSYSWSQIFLY